MIKVVIIDDEAPAREIVRDYLEKFPGIQIVGECSDGFCGLKAIQEKKPDLIFLDVQMPKLTGIELLEVLDDKPAVIFTTAYDQYAIQAFEQNAVDYLLKPFGKDRFRQAVQRALSRLEEGKAGQPVEKLGQQIEEQKEVLNRVVAKFRNEIRIIPVDHIFYIEAQDDYVMIYLENEKYLKQKTMKYFEDHLDSTDFVRVHRSFLARVDKIRKIEPYEKSGGIAVFKDGRHIPVSRSGFARLKEVLDH